ncbi:transposable element Tcb2 transposase [Trichonephila clavipes]|nr:transposable element Tcb2 transposase [Trichonephila clavipes]
MNPIEHVWDALGRQIAGHQSPPQTLQEQERALLEEWDKIPQLVINSLIDSMPQSYRFWQLKRLAGRYEKVIPCWFQYMHFISHNGCPTFQQPMTRYFQWMSDRENVLAMATVEYLLYRGRLEHDKRHAVFGYHVITSHCRMHKDRAQSLTKIILDVQITDDANMRSWYHVAKI